MNNKRHVFQFQLTLTCPKIGGDLGDPFSQINLVFVEYVGYTINLVIEGIRDIWEMICTNIKVVIKVELPGSVEVSNLNRLSKLTCA